METGTTDEATRRWGPAPSPGGLIGGLGIIVAALLAVGAIVAAAGKAALPLPAAVSWGIAVVLIGLVIGFGFLLWGYHSIAYDLTARELIIRWAYRRDRVELSAINHVGPATDMPGEHPGAWQRFWPGYYVSVRPSMSGPVRVVATLPPRRQLLVSTAAGHYAISPERAVLFVEECGRLRRALGVEPAGPAAPEADQGAPRLVPAGRTSQAPITLPPRPTFDDEPGPVEAAAAPPAAVEPGVPSGPGGSEPEEGERRLLSDTPAVASLVVAVALNLGMVGYILARYGSMAPSIALHWNVNGLPDRVGSPREIWTLPLITGLVTLANLGLAWSVVRFDRFAARFLLVAACLVQLVAWVAVISLLRR